MSDDSDARAKMFAAYRLLWSLRGLCDTAHYRAGVESCDRMIKDISAEFPYLGEMVGTSSLR